MYSVALIGHGYWGQKLEEYIIRNKELSLKVVCDSKTWLPGIFNDKEIKGVVIATPPETHYEIVKGALAAGKHVLCEKPYTKSYKECMELNRMADRAGAGVLVDYTFTFSPSLVIAKNLVKVGAIGRLQNITANMKQWGRFNIGGVYWRLATHLLAVVDMFTPVLFCICKARTLQEIEGEIREAEIEFTTGDLKGKISVSTVNEKKERTLVLTGTAGEIKYNGVSTPSLECEGFDDRSGVWNEKEGDNLLNVISYFVSMMGGEVKGNSDMAAEVTGVIENII